MPPTPEWKVPEKWTKLDRRLYLRIAKRRKSEHALGYAVIAVGAQLYYKLQTHLADRPNSECGESEDEDDDDVSASQGSDGDTQAA